MKDTGAKYTKNDKKNGILPDVMIRDLIENQVITCPPPLPETLIQPASLDLRLGTRCWRMRASFLPGRDGRIKDRLEAYALHVIDLTQGAVLETGCVYLAEIQEGLCLPEHLSASANPKSSTGRLDVFTRIITEGGTSFDTIPAGYHGALYAEISPRTFPILVRQGSRLSQIRFRSGFCRLDDVSLAALHQKEQIVDQQEALIQDGIGLSIDLSGFNSEGLIGYRAKRFTGVVDVDRVGVYPMDEFWEPLRLTSSKRRELVLDPDAFYILASAEAVHIPPDYAAEMVPFDAMMGEFRVHYAGFFDPGFGHFAAGGKGARAVLEVRCRDVPFIVEHGQMVGRLFYEHMFTRPHHLYGQALTSNYQAQGLKLSKHFIA